MDAAMARGLIKLGHSRMASKKYLGLVTVFLFCYSVRLVYRTPQDDPEPPVVPAEPTTSTATRHPDHDPRIEPAYPDVHYPSPDLLIFIQSKPTYFRKRQMIRDTWGDRTLYAKHKVEVIFAMGCDPDLTRDQKQDLLAEIQDRRDILLMPFLDTYDNLTLKGLNTMRWISDTFPSPPFVLKTDDDTLLDVFIWTRFLDRVKSAGLACAIICHVHVASPVVFRNEDPKHGLLPGMLNQTHYPSFCGGAGYMFTPTAFLTVLQATKHVPIFIRDDPYFTGMIPHALGLPLIALHKRHVRFRGRVKVESLMKGPPIILHELNDKDWQRIWTSILTEERLGRPNYPTVHMKPLGKKDHGGPPAELDAHTARELMAACPKQSPDLLNSLNTVRLDAHV